MAIQQKLIFSAGMNSDSAEEIIADGQSPYRINVRVLSSDNATVGAAETVNGNTLVSFILPTGNNTVVGSKEDLLRKKLYYFVHNSAFNHTILEYDEQTNTVSKVFQDSVNILDNQVNILRFKLENLITGINIVELDKDNHLLYWTDNWVDPADPFNYNEPKKINIEKGKFFMSGNFVDGYPSPFDPENLFWIKQPPQCEPTGLYFDDPLVNINYLEQKLFQFKVQFVYDDKEESAWSPISKTIYPECDCGNNGSSTLNNYIQLTFETGIEIVKRIKIACKEVNQTDFTLVVELDKDELNIPSNSTHTFNFYNDGNYLPIEINESIKLYDKVPKRAKATEVIEGTRVVWGNITEEFDPVDVDLKLNLELAEDYVEPTYSIRGNIFVPNLSTSITSQFNKYQPIQTGDHTLGGQACFGGIHNLNPFEGSVEKMYSYNQALPLGGFVVYLAGTDHYAISSQNPAPGVSISAAFPGRNVYEFSTIANKDAVRDAMTSAAVYSEFRITGVPAGNYIMRISPDLDQTHSTYTCGVCGYDEYECVLTIEADGRITIGSTTYPKDPDLPLFAAPVYLPATYVLDMTSGNSNDNAFWFTTAARFMVVDGYLKDSNGTQGIEQARVRFTRSGNVPVDIQAVHNILNLNLTNAWGAGGDSQFITNKIARIVDWDGMFGGWLGKDITDHNGFFSCLSLVGLYPGQPNVCPISPSLEIDSFYIANISVSVTNVYSAPHCWKSASSTSTKSVASTNYVTSLQGVVTFQGNPVSGVIAVSTLGGVGISDSGGNFFVVIYPNTDVTTRTGAVLFYLDGTCIAVWDGNAYEAYSLGYGADPLYNYQNFFQLQSLNLLEIIGNESVPSLKRGGVYLYGIIYYDHGNRSGLTNVNDWRFDTIDSNENKYGTKLFVPFYTKDDPNNSAELSFDMEVDGAIVLSEGSGYTGATIATLTGGGFPTAQATASVDIGTGFILSIGFTVGAGYTPGTYIAVPLIGGTGVGGTADVTVDGAGLITDVVLNGVGNGYLTGDLVSPDTAVVGVPGISSVFTLQSDFETILGLTILTGGGGAVGYTSLPTITITDAGGGVGADVVPTMKVQNINIISPGSGYSLAPAIVFSGGSPTINAEATAVILGGAVVSVTIDDTGSSYKSFPNLSIAGQIYGGSFPFIDWEIYNSPPSWATHYQIARSRDSSTNYYLDSVVTAINYIDDEGNSVSFGLATQMKVNILNLSVTYKKKYPDSILSYDFVVGNRIVFIRNANGDFYDDYYDFKITKYDSGTGYIYMDVNNLMPEITAGALFEIYVPKLNVTQDQQLMFEIGACYEVNVDSNGNYYHKGMNSDQVIWDFTDNQFLVSGIYDLGFIGTLPHGLTVGDKIKITQDPGFTHAEYNGYFEVVATPTTTTIVVNGTFLGNTPVEGGRISSAATGDFYGGDTFYRYRDMPYGLLTAPAPNRFIEDANFSDFYNSKGWDLGRPNRTDPQITEITRPSTIYYSEKLIPETNINGLSNVFDTSFQTYEGKNGGIMKLYNEDLRLIVLQELKIGQVLVSQIIYNDLQLTNTVGASNVVISPQIVYYAGEFGIGLHPESFAVYGKAKYGIDVRRGVAWRLSIDGLSPISDLYFMHNYFNDKCREILAFEDKVNIYGVFDIRFNEYVLAFENFAQEGSNAETLAFNERYNAWSTFYSFTPENMCSNGIDIVSFKNGAIWTHNTNTDQNTFYGVLTPSQLWLVVNNSPSNVKVLEAISQETNDNWVIPSITTPNNQETRILYDSNWVMKENNFYAYVKRDINTVNVTNPIVNGNVMRDRTFLIKLRYDRDTYNKIFAVNAYTIPSERSNK